MGARRDGESGKWNWKSFVLGKVESRLMKMNQCKKTPFFCGSIAEKKLYWVCRVELESHPHVCLLPGEWSFPSAPCVGIMFDRTVPAMSHLACFFCSYSRWIEYFLMCVGSILSFPSVSFFHLSSTFGALCMIQNHPIIPSPYHFPHCCFSSL